MSEDRVEPDWRIEVNFDFDPFSSNRIQNVTAHRPRVKDIVAETEKECTTRDDIEYVPVSSSGSCFQFAHSLNSSGALLESPAEQVQRLTAHMRSIVPLVPCVPAQLFERVAGLDSVGDHGVLKSQSVCTFLIISFPS